jgi:sugar/nucleoside kinase (ribokinase family)
MAWQTWTSRRSRRPTSCTSARRSSGVLIDGEEAVPTVEVDVVDTTGCGDAFTAGFLFGLAAGRERRAAAELGCAVAARVAQGLGTDAGGQSVGASSGSESR